MNVLHIVLPFPPSELSHNARGHWSKKHKAAQTYKNDCFYFGQKWAPIFEDGKIWLQILFHPPVEWDVDNMLGALKYGLDGLALAWEINDKRFRYRYLDYDKPDKKNPRVEILIKTL